MPQARSRASVLIPGTGAFDTGDAAIPFSEQSVERREYTFGFFNKNKQADAASQDENAAPTSFETSRVGLARHAVEQEMLVEYFSKNPTALIDDITEEYGLATVFSNMYRAQKLRRSPYYAEQYAIDVKKTEFDDYLIIAELQMVSDAYHDGWASATKQAEEQGPEYEPEPEQA